MTYTVAIHFDNAISDADERSTELARILRDLAWGFTQALDGDFLRERSIRDSKGNRVGTAQVSDIGET